MVKDYTEEQLAFIINKKEVARRSWDDITSSYNNKFESELEVCDIKLCYEKNKNIFKQKDNHIRTLKTIHRTKKSNSYVSKENRVILEQWNRRDDLVEAICNKIEKIGMVKYKIPKIKKNKKKKNLTLELLFSDVHYGKYIENIKGNFVDSSVIRKRVRKISKTVSDEIEREGKSFNVERLILSMMGDIIENAEMHMMESQKGCEFGSSKQVDEAIESIWFDLLLPLALTGIKIDVPCVTGNHDRNGMKKTYQKPGEDNFTYIIYKALERMAKISKLTNVSFQISLGFCTTVDVYGNTICYEHGDELKSTNRDSMYTMMAKRQAQIGKIIDFYRVGHFHEYTAYGQGKAMINGSVPGQDGYAEGKGYSAEAIQILNYYVETKKRKTCFFRSFPIYLQ